MLDNIDEINVTDMYGVAMRSVRYLRFPQVNQLRLLQTEDFSGIVHMLVRE